MCPRAHRSLESAFHEFLHELNSLLQATVTPVPLVKLPVYSDKTRSFAFGGEGYALMRSHDYGDLRLFLGQVCSAKKVDGELKLATLEYRYAIGPHTDEQPTLRWDYVKTPEDDALWCRHHLQGAARIGLGNTELALNELHMPTGYVSIEDVLRFCLHDLGVPPRDPDWHGRLTKNATQFRAKLG